MLGTRCHIEPHTGWKCDDYATHIDKSRRDKDLLDDYKRSAGTKDGPKCATLIEKVDGCNHIECSGCHGHICWYVVVASLAFFETWANTSCSTLGCACKYLPEAKQHTDT
jgi:hypothetical protein